MRVCSFKILLYARQFINDSVAVCVLALDQAVCCLSLRQLANTCDALVWLKLCPEATPTWVGCLEVYLVDIILFYYTLDLY